MSFWSKHRSQKVLRQWHEAICITLFQVTRPEQVAVKYRRMSVAYRSSVGRYVDRDKSVVISTNISVECRSTYRPIHRSICRPTYLGRHIDRHSTDMSTDVSVDTRPICRPIHRSTLGGYVDRYIGRGVHKIHMIRRFYSWKGNPVGVKGVSRLTIDCLLCLMPDDFTCQRETP